MDGVLLAHGHTAGGFQNASGGIAETTLSAPWPLRMRLTCDGTTAVLSWPPGQGHYQVQQTPDLSDPDSWQDMDAPVQTNSMSLPIGAGALFLRVCGQ